MRFAFAVLLVAISLAAFFLGRVTSSRDLASDERNGVSTAQFGDEFLVPAAATRCFVSGEAGAANVHCAHMPLAEARYEVVFYKDNLFVYRFGNPEMPVFSARGKP